MRVNIFGLGAIGSNLLVQLAKQFPDIEYTGIDFDEVETRNIGPQAYFLEHVGMKKAQIMRVVLARFIRKPKYTPYVMKVTSWKILPEIIKGADLSIDCFDNSESRQILCNAKTDMLHIGFSPQYVAECIFNERYDAPNDIAPGEADICTQRDAIPFIHFVVNAACLNVSRYLETGEKKDLLVTNKNRIKWL